MTAPEELARQTIDRLLTAAGWAVQDFKAADIHAARGVAIREFVLDAGQGFADYLLYVDGKAAGVIEAKKEGATLTGVEVQSGKYSQGLPATLPAWRRPLPFIYGTNAELAPPFRPQDDRPGGLGRPGGGAGDLTSCVSGSYLSQSQFSLITCRLTKAGLDKEGLAGEPRSNRAI